MSSFRRSAICGSFLEISTGLILPKNMYLAPMSEFQMCLLPYKMCTIHGTGAWQIAVLWCNAGAYDDVLPFFDGCHVVMIQKAILRQSRRETRCPQRLHPRTTTAAAVPASFARPVVLGRHLPQGLRRRSPHKQETQRSMQRWEASEQPPHTTPEQRRPKYAKHDLAQRPDP